MQRRWARPYPAAGGGLCSSRVYAQSSLKSRRSTPAGRLTPCSRSRSIGPSAAHIVVDSDLVYNDETDVLSITELNVFDSAGRLLEPDWSNPVASACW